MRGLLAAVALIGFVAEASAGDFELPETPVLRGTSPFIPATPTYMNWSGFYAGGQGGYGSAHINFSGATEQLYAYMLRELALENEQHVSQWQVLGSKDTGGQSIGIFAGYNGQWEDVIVGFDMHYSRTKFSATALASPIERVVSAGGNTYDVLLNGSASMDIKDWGAARIRAGYVMGNALPYATFGLAFGRADITRSAQVDGEQNPNPPAVPATPCGPPTACVPFSFASSEVRNNAWIFGWAAGGGLDFMILPNVFLRAEYEYASFAKVAGIKSGINTGRVGAAIKF